MSSWSSSSSSSSSRLRARARGFLLLSMPFSFASEIQAEAVKADFEQGTTSRPKMDKIGRDVFINHIAPFFVFEASVNPTRGAVAGHQLLQLHKWSPAQSARLKHVMHHVFSKRMPGKGLVYTGDLIREQSAFELVCIREVRKWDWSRLAPQWLRKRPNTHCSYVICWTQQIDDRSTAVLDMQLHHWTIKPHPAFGNPFVIVQRPYRWGKSL